MNNELENVEPPKSSRRSRSAAGGGGARRAERSAYQQEFSRFIDRKIPNFEILNDEAIEIIEYNAETVLEEIGVKFVDNPKALALWKNAGADVQGETVRIPRGLAGSWRWPASIRFCKPKLATTMAALSTPCVARSNGVTRSLCVVAWVQRTTISPARRSPK